jgi:hypothetical protein
MDWKSLQAWSITQRPLLERLKPPAQQCAHLLAGEDPDANSRRIHSNFTQTNKSFSMF